jgi:hypothetical protein
MIPDRSVDDNFGVASAISDKVDFLERVVDDPNVWDPKVYDSHRTSVRIRV